MKKTNLTLLSIVLLAALALQNRLNAADCQPTWELLKSAPVPEWIIDAKFGIYTHWGV
jgi:alpha-L-fucosidase